MGSREGGEEVVERVVVGDVDCRQSHADFVLVAVKEVVFSECDVEEASWLNALRIVIVVFGVGVGMLIRFEVRLSIACGGPEPSVWRSTPSQASPAWNC